MNRFLYNFVITISFFINFDLLFASNTWKLRAEQDLEAIHKSIIQNHPSFGHPQYPHFENRNQEAYELVKANLASVNDMDSYFAVLSHYPKSFNDIHLKLLLTDNPHIEDPTRFWPGLVLVYRSDKVIVHYRDPKYAVKLAPKGAVLKSCDGKNLNELFANYTEPFGTKKEDEYRELTDSLFVRIGSSPLLPKFKECTFELKGGKLSTFQLKWQDVYHASDLSGLQKAFQEIQGSNLSKFSLKPIAKGQAYWLSISSFDFQHGDKISALISEVQEKRQDITNAEFLIVDVRGNKGGQWEFGKRLIRSIWSHEALEASGDLNEYLKIWRVSTDNFISLKDEILPDTKKSFGSTSAIYQRRLRELVKFEVALKNKSEFLEIASEPEVFEPKLDNDRELSKGPQRVFFLTDSFCSSSCLLFADSLLRIPGVIHVGLTTGSDTRNVEGIVKILPSKYARLVYPTAMLPNRKRKDNEAHKPQYFFHGDINNDKNVEDWLLNLTKDMDSADGL